MATSTQTQSPLLPYGVGRFGAGWGVVFLLFLVLLAVGLYGYSRQLIEGEGVTGLRDVGTMGGAPWGLYIAFELWFVGIGFGAMMLVAAARLAHIDLLKPLVRTMCVIALATLFIGGWSIIVDLGQPVRAVVNIIKYARPMSPFFGTFTIGLVAAFAATLVYLFLDGRRDAAILARRPSRWSWLHRLAASGYTDTEVEKHRRRRSSALLAGALLVVAIVAASTSGFVFGIQQGRPGWFGALQAPGFVVLAMLTGTAATVIVAASLRSGLGEKEALGSRVFTLLNTVMLVASLVYIYFIVVEIITSSYSSSLADQRVTDALLTGEYAWMFWLSAALFIVGAALSIFRATASRSSIWLVVVAAIAIIIGALLKRYLLVVPPLTTGRLLPYADGSYSPTWVEYAVVGGLISLGVLFFMIFMKLFPILGLNDREENV
ncbi:MAG: polysulfide reductase NrfD [Dehalococcoidia bacterium]|jgi:molybdopterin-containing oxidoreductase family membrane subunit|nr:polysulfide reductase NrfD [Dehalococcoidia bacterium]